MIEPSATPPPGSAAATSAAMVDAPLSCVRCGYDLRGLPLEARCPECGVPVEVSQRERRRLADAAVPYVNTLYAGAWLVVIALVLCMLNLLGACIGGWFLTFITPTAGVRSFDIVFVALGLLQVGAWALGWWWLSARSPDWAPEFTDEGDRVSLRVATIGAAAAYAALEIMDVLMSAMLVPRAGAWAVWMMLAGGTALIAGLIHCVAAMSYARRLALRADDPALAERAKQMMWAGPVLCTVGACTIIGPLIALILYWSVVERLRAHLSAIRVARAAEFDY